VKIVYKSSLARTLDAVNEALFFGENIPKAESRRVVAWIASRQGLPESYAGMFAPTPGDFEEGIRLFTGERISTRAATGHILGEEACRALLLLDDGSRDAREALARASRSMDSLLARCEAEGVHSGFF